MKIMLENEVEYEVLQEALETLLDHYECRISDQTRHKYFGDDEFYNDKIAIIKDLILKLDF